MSKVFVCDLAESCTVNSCFAVQFKEVRTYVKKRTQRPAAFLSLTLSDRSGTIEAVQWDGWESAAAQIGVGDVIRVQGLVNRAKHNNELQIQIQNLEKVLPGEYDRADLVVPRRRELDEQLEFLMAFLDEIKDPNLRRLLSHFFDDAEFLARFAEAPGAVTVHHARPSGLLEHTLGVARILRDLVSDNRELNPDLLIAGALLHDIGKMEEIEITGGTVYRQTVPGRLLGHVMLTDRMVSAAIDNLPGFPRDLALQLSHILLAHMGTLENGSPVLPQTPEANALHHADDLDAEREIFRETAQGGKDGDTWSPYNRTIGRQIYLGEQGRRGKD